MSMQNFFIGIFLAWFAVAEMKILSGFFEGESFLYTLTHLKAWLTPVLL